MHGKYNYFYMYKYIIGQDLIVFLRKHIFRKCEGIKQYNYNSNTSFLLENPTTNIINKIVLPLSQCFHMATYS